MSYSNERLNDIYDKTDGYCHICWKRLCFSNYAKHGRRGAWEVEHSRPKSKGGTDHLNNLFAACIACNRAKGAGSTRSMRARNGRTRAPRSREAQENVRVKNTLAGAAIGGLLAGPVGVLVGGLLGNSEDPQ